MASALVLNQREQVEYQMQESLLATGTIHMLAISGMHIDYSLWPSPSDAFSFGYREEQPLPLRSRLY